MEAVSQALLSGHLPSQAEVSCGTDHLQSYVFMLKLFLKLRSVVVKCAQGAVLQLEVSEIR